MKIHKCLSGSSRLLKGMAVLALVMSVNHAALAAQYTAQEKANIQLVRDFYNALDAADAKGNTKDAIVGIAEKYIAADYKQHAMGSQPGRANLIKMFQSMPATPAGKPAFMMEPAKLVTIMAEGDLVIQITSRGPTMIWNMFRVEKGQLAEHWDAGLGGPPPGAPPAGGPPPGAPPAK